jgi:hypothetical protein
MRSSTASRAVTMTTGVLLPELEPFEARQAEVEHHGVGRPALQRRLGGDAVAHPVRREAGLREAGLQAVAEQRIVLDDEHAHQRFL